MAKPGEAQQQPSDTGAGEPVVDRTITQPETREGGGTAFRSAGSAEADTLVATPGAARRASERGADESADSSTSGEPLALGTAAIGDLPVADYLIGDEVARGGMGRVMRAVDRRLGRVVALKELDGDTPRRRERFAREAQITARLQHPSIVPIYAAGHLPGGGLAYAMKLVSGCPLDQAIREAADLPARLALVPRLIDVVDALAYAHGQGVVHRDIKPSNIILGDFGETILIDWGIAKVIGAPDSIAPDPGVDEPSAADPLADSASGGADGLTMPGSVVGTPAYMAPEQAAGDPIDDRVDVYALGSLLYQLLAGRHPYQGVSSTAILARVIAGPPPPLESVEPRVPAELAALVARAMHRDPAARYSAAELAAELRRFTTGQLIASYRYTTGERLLRFVRRHRAAVAVAGAALVALGAIASISARRVLHERDRAEAARAQAVDRVDELTVEKARIERETRPALELLAGLSPGSRHWSAARVVAADAAARGIPRMLGHHPGELTSLRFTPDGTLVSTGPDRLHLWNTESGDRLTIEVDELYDLAADGSAALVRRGGALALAALPGGQVTELGPLPGELATAVLSPDGRQVAIAAAGATELWIPGARPRWLGPAPTSGILRFAPGGTLLFAVTEMTIDHPLAAAGVGPGLGAWSLPDGSWQQISSIQFVDPGFLVVSPDAGRVAARTSKGALSVLGTHDDTFSIEHLSPPQSSERLTLPRVTRLAFAPDGKRYAVADSSHQLRVLGAGPPVALDSRDAEITGLAYLPDGSGVVASSRDGYLVYWRVGSGFLRSFAYGRAVVAIAAAPDSRSIATATDDGMLRTIVMPADQEQRWEQSIELAALSPGGGRAARTDGGLLWWPQPGAAPTALAASRPVRAIALADRALLAWDESGALLLWPGGRSDPREAATLSPAGSLLAISADGRLAAAMVAGEIARLDLESGAVRRRQLGGESVTALAISSSGELAAGRADGRITLIDRAGRERALRGHKMPPTALAFSPDGATLVSGAGDGMVGVWDVASGIHRWLSGHHGPILALAASGAEVWSADAELIRRAADDLPRGEAALRAWITSALSAPGARAVGDGAR